MMRGASLIPVVIYGLYIIVLIEKIKDPVKALDIVLVGKLHIILGDHGNLCAEHGDSGIHELLVDFIECIGIGQDLIAVFLFVKILCSGIECGHHKVI